jgi:hypothetical protein
LITGRTWAELDGAVAELASGVIAVQGDPPRPRISTGCRRTWPTAVATGWASELRERRIQVNVVNQI